MYMDRTSTVHVVARVRHDLAVKITITGLHQSNGIISWCEFNEKATKYKQRIDGLKVGTGKLVMPSSLKLLTAHSPLMYIF